MFKQRGVYGLRPLQGLLSLSRKNTADAMERAATMALQRGSWRLHDFRTLLKDEGKVVQGEFVQQHPIIRDLSAYRVAFPS